MLPYMGYQWERLSISDYPWREDFQTRWADNDQYGHVNNTVHYVAVDSAINRMLIGASDFRPGSSEEIGLVVASSCRYYREASYPATLQLGLAVAHIGRTSVHYVGGIFTTDEAEPLLIAVVHFSHAYVHRQSRISALIPAYVLKAVESLTLSEETHPILTKREIKL